MDHNLPWLFAAYAVTWVVFFLYLFFMARRQNELESEIRELRDALESKENPSNSSSAL